MRIVIDGTLGPGVHAKDVILAIIARIGTAGGAGHVIEYAGSTIQALGIEGRLTICNMSIEAGARAGMVAPDDTTFAYLQGRPYAPKRADWDQAVAYWGSLRSDDDAQFDREVGLDAAGIAPRPGGRAPRRRRRLPSAFRTRQARPTRRGATAWSARWPTWT
jgi:3-isopropylmalate/(R)-2-methylmalate dehydratase large subunit